MSELATRPTVQAIFLRPLDPPSRSGRGRSINCGSYARGELCQGYAGRAPRRARRNFGHFLGCSNLGHVGREHHLGYAL